MEDNQEEENMEYARLVYEREGHWRMDLQDKNGVMHDKKPLLYAKRQDIYMSDKR